MSEALYPPIGYMPKPINWKYDEIVQQGRPKSRHVHMPTSRRAKIFAPFDALEGFDDAVSSKEVLYEEKRRLSSEELDQLNETLARLKSLTINRKTARENRVLVEAEYYVPCDDENSFSYRIEGRYKKIRGICWNVDEIFGTIKINNTVLSLSDIYVINIIS